MARPSKATPEPPALELGDLGVRWSSDGGAVHVRRRVSFRAVLPAGLMVVLTALLAVVAWSDSVPLSIFMAFATIFPAAFLWMRIVHRAEMTIDATGVTWSTTRPRAFHGRWERRRIDGLRVCVHPKSRRWLQPREASVDLRLDGEWCTLMWPGTVRRAEPFAEAVALVLALAPERYEEPDV